MSTPIVRVLGNGGECCPCADQIGCVCTTNGCSLDCQYNLGGDTGLASLCGFVEYGPTPSLPPKKYRVQTTSSDFKFCNGASADICGGGTGSIGRTHVIISNAQTIYSETTCEITSTGLRHFGGDVAFAPCSSYDGSTDNTDASTDSGDIQPGTYPGFVLTTHDNQTVEFEPSGVCYDAGAPNYGFILLGTRSWSLSAEDTEDDAIARAIADHEWSPCAPEDAGHLTAFITLRLAGQFEFSFRSVQVRANVGSVVNPIIPGQTYKVTIGFYNRILGTSGPFIFFGIQEVTFVAEFPQDVTPWVDVPNQAGFETKGVTCGYELVP